MDEDLPRKTQAPKRNLDIMGIVELEEYIAELEQEVARVRAAIAGKRSVRGGADALFKR
jgi:uncharacterized small protein (DUF1192 family)